MGGTIRGLHSTSFAALLHRRADEDGDRQALSFLVDGKQEEASITYRGLHQQALAIAAALREVAAEGDRALLLYAPGLDYVAALFGCFYAGVVAVPAYPPDPSRLNRTLPRLEAIVRDARATVALTTSMIEGVASSLFGQSDALAAIRWLATDTVPADAVLPVPVIASESVAFLQYTSGSTATPRGVMLTHRNLLENSEFIHRAFGHSEHSQGVIWLPPYHDMGLIGGVLQPLYGRFPCTLMSPLVFLQRPLRWLQAITRLGATTSGGPNFAYDLAVRRIPPEKRDGLDLSTWDLAFNGAEPVREATLDSFTEAFAPYGFRRAAFFCCYGLAEGTLAVTGGRKALDPVIRTFSAHGIEEGQARPAMQDDRATLVGCGVPAEGHRLRIVDPDTGEACAQGQIGEIWIAGPSVAAGYWGQSEVTTATFHAVTADGDGPFLRSGDLGFTASDGELFVTGRIKDLLILRGRNYYPQDIEWAAERSHDALRRNCCAAFTIQRAGQAVLAIALEVYTHRPVDYDEVVLAIRQRVSAEVETAVHTVVLCAPRSIPKTSSGKVQRSRCKGAVERADLPSVHRWSLDQEPGT